MCFYTKAQLHYGLNVFCVSEVVERVQCTVYMIQMWLLLWRDKYLCLYFEKVKAARMKVFRWCSLPQVSNGAASPSPFTTGLEGHMYKIWTACMTALIYWNRTLLITIFIQIVWNIWLFPFRSFLTLFLTSEFCIFSRLSVSFIVAKQEWNVFFSYQFKIN